MAPFRLALLLLPLMLLSCGRSASDPMLIGFPDDVVEARRLAGSRTVAIAPAQGRDGGSVTVRVTIDTRGRVIDARQAPGAWRFGDPAAAIAAARQWRFRPFEYRGQPVTAMADVQVEYRLHEAWANPRADFPPIDYRTLRIELTRDACFGPCPIYRVTITGDGTVTYTTKLTAEAARGPEDSFDQTGVLIGGTHRTRIDRAALDDLIGKFRAARFFGLKKAYEAPITDSATYVLRFSTADKTMEVTDYVGQMVDMPEVVKTLEKEIDRVAGTARWVKGDAQTVRALVAKGFDPRSSAAADLAFRAIGSGGDAVVLDLMAAGLPLDRATAPSGQPLGVTLLEAALRLGRPRLAKALIDRGWLARLAADKRAALFAQSGGGCDPAVARAFIAAGVDPNVRGPAEEEPGIGNGGATALAAAIAPYGSCHEGIDRIALAKALIALGVDPNAPDGEGRTPIWSAEDPDLLAALLASGARANVKDKQGLSPVLGSWSDVIVLMLLEAGADPQGKDEGKTLPMLAKEHNMPAVRAWLEAHGVR